MSFYILLYTCIIVLLIYIAFISFPRYSKLLYGRFFLGGIIGYILWLLLYLLAFTTTFNPDILLILSRTLYLLSLISSYLMLLFFLFFGEREKGKSINNLVLAFIGIITPISLFSPLFINSMVYDGSLNIHYEEFGPLFILFQIAYILNPILVLSAIIYRVKKLQGINKIRFQYIGFGYILFIFLFAFFLAILPMFGIWIFQKEQILFFLPFVISFLYASYRYRFKDIYLSFGRFFIFIISIIITIGIIGFFKKYLTFIDSRLIDFWGISDGLSYIDIIISIGIFYTIDKFLSGRYLTSKYLSEVNETLFYIGERIPFIQTKTDLNEFLSYQISSKLGIKDVKMIYKEQLHNFSQLVSFFEDSSLRDIFIYDTVFIEENKNKFSKEKLLKQLDKKEDIYIPLFLEKNKVSAILCIGKKEFGDFYTSNEINIFKKFAGFLQGHLKYMSIYSQIHDLNINLDKKVDEKTIQFNSLINQQREFIVFTSHEIKNPITHSIFLIDAIKKSITKSRNISTQIVEDIQILESELYKMSELVKKIFSSEKYDLQGMKLYKKFTSIKDFISQEIQVFQSAYLDIQFDVSLEDVGNIEIDQIQMKQVFSNLISNSIKFSSSKAVIAISLFRENNKIHLIIEDNGIGLNDIHIEHIFDKYSTGESNSIGLGMGLYLCKKIVELHGGKITVEHSRNYGGARFCMIL